MQKRQEHWLEREVYSEIRTKLSSAKKDSVKNIALLGPPKTGKTSILKNILGQKGVQTAYIDINKIGLSPESFAVGLVGNVLFSFLSKSRADYKKFFDINYILTLENDIPSPAFETIKSIHNELQKIRHNQKFLIESALRFLEGISQEKKFLVLLDNFEQILDLNNFPQIKDIFSIIDFKQKNVIYIITSSAINEIKNSLKDFDIIEIKNFDFNETCSFFGNFGITDKKSIEKIHKLTDGNPYLISLIAKNKEKKFDDFFVSNIVSKNGLVYSHCSIIYENFLKRTSGQTLSKIILKVIAENEGLRLTEIANKIFRSAPVTKALLERLISSDIICKKDNRYYFCDFVLGRWIKLTSSGYEFEDCNEIPEEDLKEALRQYEQ